MTRCPIHAPISTANSGETRIKIKKDGQVTEQSERLASVRAEIAARVANFKAMQERFQREREEYFVTTLEKARNGSSGRRSWT
jgi:chorismate mutase